MRQIKDVLNIKKLIAKDNIDKVLIISGRNSFYKTGADKIFSNILKKKNYLFISKRKIFTRFY